MKALMIAVVFTLLMATPAFAQSEPTTGGFFDRLFGGSNRALIAADTDKAANDAQIAIAEKKEQARIEIARMDNDAQIAIEKAKADNALSELAKLEAIARIEESRDTQMEQIRHDALAAIAVTEADRDVAMSNDNVEIAVVNADLARDLANENKMLIVVIGLTILIVTGGLATMAWLNRTANVFVDNAIAPRLTAASMPPAQLPGPTNILIASNHDQVEEIMKRLGVTNEPAI